MLGSSEPRYGPEILPYVDNVTSHIYVWLVLQDMTEMQVRTDIEQLLLETNC